MDIPKSFGDKMYELFYSSSATQGFLTIIVVSAWIYMLISGIIVPPSMELVVGTIVGFFFGGKAQNAITNARRETDRAKTE